MAFEVSYCQIPISKHSEELKKMREKNSYGRRVWKAEQIHCICDRKKLHAHNINPTNGIRMVYDLVFIVPTVQFLLI